MQAAIIYSLVQKKSGKKEELSTALMMGMVFRPKFHNFIFQARVTSKLEDGVKDSYGFHGRGMALFSVKLNAEKYQDYIFRHQKRDMCVC